MVPRSSSRLGAFVLGLLVATAAAGCRRDAAEPATADQVMATLHAACKAYLDADPARIEALLTDDFTLTDSQGVVTTRADDLDNARRGPVRYTQFENHDMKVRLHGDAAVVTGRTLVKGQAGDKAFAAEMQFTDTVVRDGGRWRVASSHVSRLP